MELIKGQKYNVRVIKLLDCGAVVEMEDGTTSLIHVSKVSKEFVKDVGCYLSVDRTYEAEGVQGRAHPVELSLLHLGLTNSYKQLEDQIHVVEERATSRHRTTSHTYHDKRSNTDQDMFDTSDADAHNRDKSRRKQRYNNRNYKKRRNKYDC